MLTVRRIYYAIQQITHISFPFYIPGLFNEKIKGI
jgi:hypothetical protein